MRNREAQTKRAEADAKFAAIPGRQFLYAIAARAKLILQLRWPHPHNSFTRKGPGLKHDDGLGSRAKPIHKSLTKQVHRPVEAAPRRRNLRVVVL